MRRFVRFNPNWRNFTTDRKIEMSGRKKGKLLTCRGIFINMFNFWSTQRLEIGLKTIILVASSLLKSGNIQSPLLFFESCFRNRLAYV